MEPAGISKIFFAVSRFNKLLRRLRLTPSAIACAIPNLGTFLAQRGLKWSVRQIFPPRYIFAVFPSNSGSAISGAVAGYVTGICGEISPKNLYFALIG